MISRSLTYYGWMDVITCVLFLFFCSFVLGCPQGSFPFYFKFFIFFPHLIGNSKKIKKDKRNKKKLKALEDIYKKKRQ